jgi:hypothetical protein
MTRKRYEIRDRSGRLLKCDDDGEAVLRDGEVLRVPMDTGTRCRRCSARLPSTHMPRDSSPRFSRTEVTPRTRSWPPWHAS